MDGKKVKTVQISSETHFVEVEEAGYVRKTSNIHTYSNYLFLRMYTFKFTFIQKCTVFGTEHVINGVCCTSCG